jgi:hypothetical protein
LHWYFFFEPAPYELYKLGWRGINIEARPGSKALFAYITEVVLLGDVFYFYYYGTQISG